MIQNCVVVRLLLAKVCDFAWHRDRNRERVEQKCAILRGIGIRLEMSQSVQRYVA